MKQTKVAGRAMRGPFCAPFRVRCESTNDDLGVFYLQAFWRGGHVNEMYWSIDAARAAARAESERQRTQAGRIISACILDADRRIADAFTAGGPWLGNDGADSDRPVAGRIYGRLRRIGDRLRS